MNTEPVFAHLRVMASDGAEHVVPISHSPFCIGRAGHNDLALAGEQISRHHACLRVEGDQIQLIDMGSENGTWIGTTQLVPNQAQTLDFFEKFRIGSYQFRLEPASVAPARPEVAKASTPSPTLAPTAAYDMGKSFQPPIEPRVTSSPGGRLGVMVRTTQLVVTPGISANVSLVIMNQSQNSDGFRITVSGIPESWLTAPLPIVELPPNERQEVNLTIHPPRSPQTRADSYRLSLQVTSQSVLTEMVEVWATLTIVAYSAFATRLHPPRVDAHDPAQIVVRNDGNAAETFRLTWEDPEDRYEFRPAELQMTLAAGETAATEFRAIPRRRRLFGGSQIDVYSATITPAGGQPRSHTGQIVTTGLLPVWSIAILFLLVTLCAVGSGATALALFGTTPTPDATGIVTPTPTGTVTGLDSDGDGLIDEEEARLGSDPRSPDTDRDGLTDFDEVRRGTSPILADTDGDTLLDGQEAFGCSDPRNPDTDGDGQRDNIDPDPCRLPTPTNIPAPTMTPIPTLTPLPSATPIPTSTPLPTNTPLPTDTPLPTATPTALPSPTPIITEWRGEYYGTTDLLGTPLVVRNEVDVNFNWGSSSPDPLIPADRFSARWTRTLNFEGRMYRFSVQADDGVRVFVDNILIIDEWHAAPPFPPTYTADVNLTPGPHTLRVEYYEDVIDAYLLFSFTAAP